MNDLKCPICGEPTYLHFGHPLPNGLCSKHGKMANKGEIIQCPNCGNWHKMDEDCECKKYEQDQYCIVCGKRSNGKPQCYDCYSETKNYIDGLDKNTSISENRNYYYNLKDYAFRRTTIEGVMTNCNKLIAVAINNENVNGDNCLLERVYKDVASIIAKKKTYFEEQEKKRTMIPESQQKTNEKITEKENIVYYKYAEDGHAMDSEMEIKIDDMLYSAEIFHCCHKPITEILSQNKTSDWFIPIEGVNKGIYIEYWGMDTPKYIAEKEEKIALYKKYDVPFIEIQKDEPKNNSQLFKANLIREITQKATEYFGKMPKWTKS